MGVGKIISWLLRRLDDGEATFRLSTAIVARWILIQQA